MGWPIYHYESPRGDKPVEEFVKSLDNESTARVLRAVKLLETNGPHIRMPYSKKLDDNLYELRVHGQLEIRVFYTASHGGFMLLHAFQKKTQKLPIRELKTARNRLAS
jgi:phage-related protein